MFSDLNIPAGLRRAAVAWESGNVAQWVTAFWAARCVGRMEKGATIALARSIARSVDTVERLAMAVRAYRHMLRYGCADAECRNKLREARRRLSYSHFAAAYKALADEKDPSDVVADVLVAAEEGSGVRVLAAALAGRLGGGRRAETPLRAGEYRLPTFTADSELFRQAVATGDYRIVLVDKNADTVIVRYP